MIKKGQLLNDATLNAAFMSKSENNSILGTLTSANTMTAGALVSTGTLNVTGVTNLVGGVGIGATAVPGRALDVTGDIRLTGKIYTNASSLNFLGDTGSAMAIKIGSAVISSSYSDVAPTNGLFVKGQIQSTVAAGTAPFIIASNTVVTNLNVDLLDGRHESELNVASAAKLTTARTITLTGDVSGSVSFDGSANISLDTTVANDSHTHTIGYVTNLQTALDSKEFKQSVNTIRVNLGTPTVAEMALLQAQFNNKLRFVAPSTIEDSIDGGTTWTTSTDKIPSSNTVRDMMTGNGVTGGFTIARDSMTRLTWIASSAGVGYVYLSYLYTFWSTAIHTCAVKIEGYKDVDSTWYTIATTGSLSGWPAHVSIPHSNMPFATTTGSSYYNKVRLTFIPTWSTDTQSQYYNSPISIQAIEWWGGYPSGKRDIFGTDRDKNISFPAKVSATEFTGNATSASKLAAIRKINLTGDATGSVDFDGSADVSISTTVAGLATKLNLSGGTLTGPITLPASRQWPTNSAYGINLTNSDVIGANSIYFADECGASEGLFFPKTGGGGSTTLTDYDNVRALDGILYLNGSKIWHAGNDGAGSTLDADLLDGLQATAFAPSGYGLGTVAADVSNQDANNILQTGWYRGLAIANGCPRGATNWQYLMVINHDSASWIYQLGIDFDSGGMYWRTKSGGTWTRWKALLSVGSTDNANGFFDKGTTAPTGTARINYSGYLYATKVYGAVFNDYAEYFEKNEDGIEPGDIISRNPDGDGYVKSTSEFDPLVVGIVSDNYSHCIGGNGDGHDDEGYAPTGLAGRVKPKVTGRVCAGDLIVASSIPGVGMSANGTYKPGTVVAKALENHDGSSVDRISALVLNA